MHTITGAQPVVVKRVNKGVRSLRSWLCLAVRAPHSTPHMFLERSAIDKQKQLRDSKQAYLLIMFLGIFLNNPNLCYTPYFSACGTSVGSQTKVGYPADYPVQRPPQSGKNLEKGVGRLSS